HIDGNPIPVKIQNDYETLEDAIEKLEKATKGKEYPIKIVIQTKETEITRLFDFQTEVKILKSLELQAKEFAKTRTKAQHLI
ncbi:MAG: hypothetical protein QG594_1084, partial [Bacteroidota bacterium]|nr:hypothetical protein [Bacteroidota bacterium]